MKDCFGYIRVSSQKQGEGVSLEMQKDAISVFAEQNNLQIARWFTEKETAAKSGRPVFNEMLKELKRGRASGMIIHRIDRSARNFRDWGAIGELSDAGIDIHFATESLDFRSRGGRLVADIQMAVAADYCRNLSIEARKGIHGRFKQGYYPFAAPIGYLDNGGGRVKTPDPIRAPQVKRLFDLYLTGEHSIRSVHVEIVAQGLTSKAGKPISRRTVENILSNAFYCGITTNGRTGEAFEGKHDPLITPPQFERVQRIKSGKYTKKKTRHDHLYRRLFRCQVCDALLTPERQKQQIYYRCHTLDCVARTIREDAIEQAISTGLTELSFTQGDVEYLRAKYETWDLQAKFTEERRSHELRLADLEARKQSLTGFLLDGTIDKETYQEQSSHLLLSISSLKSQIIEREENAIHGEDIEKFFELMKTVAELYEIAKPSIKRGIAQICFSNRTWDGKYLTLEPSKDILQVKSGAVAPYCGPTRDTFRTIIELFDE